SPPSIMVTLGFDRRSAVVGHARSRRAEPFCQAIMLLPLVLAAAVDSTTVIRVNQVGYRPDGPKVAVACSLADGGNDDIADFVVRDSSGRVRFGPARVHVAGSFGPCARTWRLDFSGLRRAGVYFVESGGVRSSPVRIGQSVYAGGADTLLMYLRQQR